MLRHFFCFFTLLSLSLHGSPMKLQEALAELDEQHLAKGFSLFLEAIKEPLEKKSEQSSADELALYQEALELYLNPEGKRPEEVAEEIIAAYKPIVVHHAHYSLLNFLVANAHANRKEYREFFEGFYRSYQVYPDHYLVDKTRAIIHLRLMERMSLPVEREQHRVAVVESLKRAAAKYPADLTLYRMILSLGTEEEKEGVLQLSLNTILQQNLKLPRSDIFPFVKDAVSAEELELAQQLIDRALEWYRYSRSINAAQRYLDQHRERHG